MWNELKSKVNCRLNESELHNCGAGCSRLKCSQQHSGRAQGDKTSPLNQNLIKALWSDKCRPTDHFSLLLRKLPNRNRPEPTLESKLILQKFMILIWTMHAHQSNEYHEFWGYISAKMPKLKGSEFKNPLPELQLAFPANFPRWKNFACWKFPRWKSVAGNAGKMEIFFRWILIISEWTRWISS